MGNACDACCVLEDDANRHTANRSKLAKQRITVTHARHVVYSRADANRHRSVNVINTRPGGVSAQNVEVGYLEQNDYSNITTPRTR